MPLHGKTALVTGAAGAIGSAIARGLARQKAQKVVLVDIDEHALTRLQSEIGHQALAVALDLSDAEAIGTALAVAERVDILINNAGVLSNNKLQATSLDEWRSVHTINLDAAFLLAQQFLPGMVENGWGRIINISSYAAKCGGLTAGTAYSTSKAALTGLTFSIAREFAGMGITANGIAPAYVLSPMVSEQLTSEQRSDLLATIPVGKFCSPEEVAHTVGFLASPLAAFITGEVIDMNGGLQFD